MVVLHQLVVLTFVFILHCNDAYQQCLNSFATKCHSIVICRHITANSRVLPLYSSVHTNDVLKTAVKDLEAYNINFLLRVKTGRKDGKAPDIVDYERMQELGLDGIKKEKELLEKAISLVSSKSKEVTLGIMAKKGKYALKVLITWVESLKLPRGVVRIYDDYGNEFNDITKFDDIPVYVKYNSTDNGDCYIKQYNGEFTGVIFQPKIADDDEFRQYGDFSLLLFK